MKSGRWRRFAAALGTISVVLLSGCTSSAPKKRVGPCQGGCTGIIGGAHYLIKVPHDWNGTLLIFSHGYQFAGTPLHPFVSPQDLSGTGDDALSRALLDKGFALAGSSWSSTEWAVKDGVDAADKLYQRFTDTVRKPTRTYAWGSSLGGLVTEQLAEHAGWVDGAAPMCGVVAGPLPNYDNWLEAIVATQTLLGAKFTIGGPLSAIQAKAESAAANSVITAARRDRDGGGAAKLLFIADLVGLPDRSSLFEETGQGDEIGAAWQNLEVDIPYWLKFLAEARAEFGGNPAKLFSASTASISDAQLAKVTALGGDPNNYAKQIDTLAATVDTSSDARAKLAETGDPTGDLPVPTVTMHGTDDPLAIVQNETLLSGRVAARDRAKQLMQLFVAPEDAEPSHGYQHCAFTTDQELALIDTLDQWVRQGVRPAQSSVVDAFEGSLNPGYLAQTWPSGAR